jgi:hypothetical protein
MVAVVAAVNARLAPVAAETMPSPALARAA